MGVSSYPARSGSPTGVSQPWRVIRETAVRGGRRDAQRGQQPDQRGDGSLATAGAQVIPVKVEQGDRAPLSRSHPASVPAAFR